MEHQGHPSNRQRAGSPQAPAIVAAKHQHGKQRNNEDVEPGDEGIAVAAGAAQPLDLQPEGEKQQCPQQKAPAALLGPHAAPQGRQHQQGDGKSQPNDLQRVQLAREQLHCRKGGAPYGGDEQEGGQPAFF